LDPERPAFKHIIIRPRPVGDLAWVEARHESIYGPIEVAWRRGDGSFRLDLTVPVNATATVYVPATANSPVSEGGRPAAEAPGVRFLRLGEGAAVYEVGSGRYRFLAAH
jgi:alpha-L-rhamnosidase